MKRTVRVRDNIQRSVQSRATVRLRDTCFYVGAGHFTTFGAQVLCEKSSERRSEWNGVEWSRVNGFVPLSQRSEACTFLLLFKPRFGSLARFLSTTSFVKLASDTTAGLRGRHCRCCMLDSRPRIINNFHENRI